MLDGTTNEADARLIADIMAAPDPFDGGCPADVEQAPATPSKPKDDFLDFIMDKMHQQRRLGIKEGLIDAHDWLRANGFKEAAHELTRAAAKIRERIDSELDGA